MKLSAIVIVSSKDRQSKLAKRAISSVSFADEVIVEEVAAPIEDFSVVRNRAASRASGDWVLFVDSDELVPPPLRDEILSLVNSDPHDAPASGYFIPRRDYFLGRWLAYGETGRTRLLRLARRGGSGPTSSLDRLGTSLGAGLWRRPVHEYWDILGNTATLSVPLLHYPHQNLASMLETIDRYTTLEAAYRTSSSKTILLVEMICLPVGKFLFNYVIRLGFLDRMPGLIHALMMSFHSFLVRVKQIQTLSNEQKTRNRNHSGNKLQEIGIR